MRDATSDHRRSVNARATERAVMPGFTGLLRWFLGRWSAEMPERMHVAGVEWETPGRIVRSDGSAVTDPGGGSHLGSPRLAPGVRAYVYGSPFRTEHPSSDGRPEVGETYASPLRATLTQLEYGRHPLKAAWLRAVARNGGDWRITSTAAGIPDEYGEAITRDALRLVWMYFTDGPSTRLP